MKKTIYSIEVASNRLGGFPPFWTIWFYRHLPDHPENQKGIQARNYHTESARRIATLRAAQDRLMQP